jgi:hypothetical protein
MRSQRLARALGVAVAIAAFVACSGGRMLPSFDSPGSTAGAAASPLTCTAPASRIPGTYAELIAFGGTVRGSTFTSGKGGLSLWLLAKFVKATPGPTPSPGSTATPKPTPTPVVTAPPGQPLYVYFGTYVLKKYGQGCALLIASVNGKTIKGQKGSGLAVGFPNFKSDTRPLNVTEGALTMTISNLGVTGGKGSAILANPKGGANIDTGTVTFVGRVEIKP